MSLIIHIGTGKTGTTSIQASLNLNRKKLISKGMNYPSSKNGEHNILEGAVLPYEKLHRVFRSEYSADKAKALEDANELCEKIRKSVAENDYTIISGEYFLTLDASTINQLLDKFGLTSESKITIICYVRKPSSYWLSAIQQGLKGSTKVDNVIERKYPFRTGLQNWIDVFGMENIIVRPFDRNQLLDGDVVSDFYETVYNLTNIRIENPLLAEEKNSSVSAEKCILMQELRRDLIDTDDDVFSDESRNLIRLINANGKNLEQTKMKFHPYLADFIDFLHSEDLEWLEENFNVHLSTPNSISDKDKKSAIRIFTKGRVRQMLFGYNHDNLRKYRKIVTRRFKELK